MNEPSTIQQFSSASNLDDQVVDQIRELGCIEELVQAYLDELPKRIQLLHSAIDGHDPVATMRIAHAFKGISISMGAKGVAERCAYIEKTARSGTLVGVPEVLADLEQSLESVKQAFNQACASSAQLRSK